MRHAHIWRPWLGNALVGVYLFSLIAVAVFTWAQNAQTPAFLSIVKKMASQGLPIAVVVATLSTLVHHRLGTASRWNTVHRILSALQGVVFAEEKKRGDLSHNHRITLFKKCWPRDRLLPVARSGDATMRSSASFRAPMDNPNAATGVAGHAFFRDDIPRVGGLPDVSGLSGPPSDGDIAEYARKTWSTVEYVKRRRPLARSYVAHKIVVNREPWGVLIVDSTEPEPKLTPEDLRAYSLVATTIGTILE